MAPGTPVRKTYTQTPIVCPRLSTRLTSLTLTAMEFAAVMNRDLTLSIMTGMKHLLHPVASLEPPRARPLEVVRLQHLLPSSPLFHLAQDHFLPLLILVYMCQSALSLEHPAHLDRYSMEKETTLSPTPPIPLTHAPMDPMDRITVTNPST